MAISTSLDRIRAYAKAKGLKPATLARLAGLHANALRGLHDQNWNPRADTLQKVEQAIERHERAAA